MWCSLIARKGHSTEMVDRWEGIVRACLFGCNLPTRVMASLLLCPHSRTLQKPSKNAVFFMGDCVQGSGNPTIDRLSRLETVSSILLSKLGDPLANVWVVEASRFNGAFACYEGFLSSMSSRGEPLSYKPHNFPASRAISSLLHNCLVEVNKQLAQRKVDDQKSHGEGKGENQAQCSQETPHSIPKTLLFGFSKGGVVLNQLLSEMSYAAAKHSTSLVDDLHNNETLRKQKAESKNCNPEHALLPSEFLVSIVAIHYVDVGLNCPGAYQTDATILENVVRAATASSSGLHLGFHGTPRQWKDLQRPWIASEKDDCINHLRMIAQRDDTSKITFSEKLYFEHQKPSLQMHFEILECLQIDQLQSL